MRVLIIGGSGVFGARLAGLLVTDGHDVTIAGRTQATLDATVVEHGGTALLLDRDASDLAERLMGYDVVIDGAGPWQAYARPHVAQAAIRAGAHYLDLCDDADFTANISALDADAKAAGVAVISGVSSVPALSSAAATELAQGLTDIHLIESTILPGNRAPRGLSVMRAILAQAGRPLRFWHAGEWIYRPGWSTLEPVPLTTDTKSLKPRRASLIGAPDLALFPSHFRTRSARFRAGLELPILHLGLWALAWLTRLKLIANLATFARPMRWLAARFEPFGTDEGGMVTRVLGFDADGQAHDRRWTLIVSGGDGPTIPTIAGRVMVERLAEGETAPGARPCMAEFPLTQAVAAMAELRATTVSTSAPIQPMFATMVDGFDTLPAQTRALHDVLHARRWKGRARITRGTHPLARVVSWVFRFPKATPDTPAEVLMERTEQGETWTRTFDRDCFCSHLAHRGGRSTERFGALKFELDLHVSGGDLHYPVKRGWALGIPIPSFLLPTSQATERVEDGRITFNVRLSAPIAGLLVHYEGWLEAADDPKV